MLAPKNNLFLFAGLVLADQLVQFGLKRLTPALIHSTPFFSFTSPALKLALGGIILLFLFLSLQKLKHTLAFVLLFSGWFSNCLSFIHLGIIIDYISTGMSYINTADLMIVAGGILLLKQVVFTWSDSSS